MSACAWRIGSGRADRTSQLLKLSEPLGVHATYLVRDGFVLELIDYSRRA